MPHTIPPPEERRSTDIPATQADVRLLEVRVASCEEAISGMNSTLTTNNEMTAQTKQVLDAVTMGLRVLGYIGTATQKAARVLVKVAKAAVAVYAAWQFIRHGGGDGPKP